MILLDVNVLIYAHRADAPHHPEMLSFLNTLIAGDEAFGVPEIVFSSVVRVTTQNVWKPPSTIHEALDFCSGIKSSPNCIVLQPSPNHWMIFDRLCRTLGARAKLVPDAYLASFALDRGDEWVTADRDYAKFPGLRWRHPLESHARTNPR